MSTIEAVTSPHTTLSLENTTFADAAFLSAYTRGRLHHAWLLCGPQGVGKATFAFRCARFLMGKDRDSANGPLGMSGEDADGRLISARTHPDLLVLEREAATNGQLRKNIVVDAVREIGEFFSKAPSRSPYRVCIVDSVDDLNINSANALLKILEEPPHKGVLFLISHSPGRLLATIRSRCRRLTFPAWADADVENFVARRLDVSAEDRERLVRLAGGAPGLAVSLASQGALEIDMLAQTVLENKSLSRPELAAVAQRFRSGARSDGAATFGIFLDCLRARLRDQTLNASTAYQAQVLSAEWSAIGEAEGAVEGVNLDRVDFFYKLYSRLKEVS